MQFDWMKIPYALLTLFIVLNFGLLQHALIAKIAARVGRRHGIPIWQNYIDLFKNYALRSTITHGVMYYLGPVFRLSGGVGLLLFVETLRRVQLGQDHIEPVAYDLLLRRAQFAEQGIVGLGQAFGQIAPALARGDAIEEFVETNHAGQEATAVAQVAPAQQCSQSRHEVRLAPGPFDRLIQHFGLEQHGLVGVDDPKRRIE